MFRDDQQKCQAIRILLRQIGKVHLWGSDGPTHEAYTVCSDPFALSRGEVVLLNVCWDIWDPLSCKATLGDIMSKLDSNLQLAIANLWLASVEGPDAVDRWILDRWIAGPNAAVSPP